MDFGLFYYCQGRGVPHDQAYAEMLDRMLSTLGRDRERFVTALGERQYRCLLLRMKAARAAWPASWLFIARSWLV